MFRQTLTFPDPEIDNGLICNIRIISTCSNHNLKFLTMGSERCVRAAVKVQGCLKTYELERTNEEKPFFEARLGIHTGPLVVGIVGSDKFAYDMWGDTANTAAGMESSGEISKVNVSHNTFLFIPKIIQFEFDNRGKIAARGKGEMEMYFVTEKNDRSSVLTHR